MLYQYQYAGDGDGDGEGERGSIPDIRNVFLKEWANTNKRNAFDYSIEYDRGFQIQENLFSH